METFPPHLGWVLAKLPPKEASDQKNQCCFFLRIENTALPSTNKNIGFLGIAVATLPPETVP